MDDNSKTSRSTAVTGGPSDGLSVVFTKDGPVLVGGGGGGDGGQKSGVIMGVGGGWSVPARVVTVAVGSDTSATSVFSTSGNGGGSSGAAYTTATRVSDTAGVVEFSTPEDALKAAKFAEEMILSERERCARIAEGTRRPGGDGGNPYHIGWHDAITVIAHRIRK